MAIAICRRSYRAYLQPEYLGRARDRRLKGSVPVTGAAAKQAKRPGSDGSRPPNPQWPVESDWPLIDNFNRSSTIPAGGQGLDGSKIDHCVLTDDRQLTVASSSRSRLESLVDVDPNVEHWPSSFNDHGTFLLLNNQLKSHPVPSISAPSRNMVLRFRCHSGE